MLSKSFKASKCKTSLRLAAARIKLMKNNREVQVKKMRGELAQLLQTGQDQTARIRVEHVIQEEKTMAAYDLIELYCELLIARLPIIESQKSCPIDLKEAVASVVFASPRCADVPELMDVRKQFKQKYGKEFINSALEIRPDCGVSRLVVEKLSAKAPDIETKRKTLTTIAQEHNVKWEPKSFEDQLQKAHEDLLNGPTSFASASSIKKPMEFSNVKPSPSPMQTDEASTKITPNVTVSRPMSYSNFSETNTRTFAPTQTNESGTRMPQNGTASRPTSFNNFSETNRRIPDTKVPFNYPSESRNSEIRSGGGDFNKSLPREQNASLNRPAWNMEFEDAASAAQVAAESAEKASMAARAAVELASCGNLSRKNSTGSNESPRYSNRYEKPEKIMGKHIAEESVPEVQNLQKDERLRNISRKDSGRTSNDYSTGRRPTSRSSSLLSQNSVSNEMLNNLNVNSSKAASSHNRTADVKLWDSDIYKNENDKGEKTSEMDAGKASFRSKHKQSTSGDSFGVVFDNYDSDAEENNSVFRRNRGNLLDSIQGQERSGFQSNRGPFSDDQSRSGLSAKKSFTEFRPEEQFETKGTLLSKSNDSAPPAFDDSDAESTRGGEDVANSTHKEAMRPSNFLHKNRHSTKSSFSDESTPGSNQINTGKAKVATETIRNSRLYEENIERDSYNADKYYKKSSSINLLDTLINSNVSVPDYNSTDEEEPQPLRLTKSQPMRETEAKERSRMPSRQSTTDGLEVSNELTDDSRQGINFGRLTGGFKQRGFPRPPYAWSSVADASHTSKQITDATSVAEKPIIVDLDKEIAYKERDDKKSRPKAYASKSRISRSSMDSQFDTAEDTPSNKTKVTEDVDAPTQKSYYQRPQRKELKEVGSNFQGSYYEHDSNEQTRYTTATRRYSASSEVLDLDCFTQKPSMKATKELSSRMPYIDSEHNKEKLDSKANEAVKLSWKTRDVPLESNSNSSRGTTPLSNPTNDAVTIHGKGSSMPTHTNPSAEYSSLAPKETSSTSEETQKSSQLNRTDNVVPTNNGNTTMPYTSTGESVSRENSLNKASHTHPKLPDYDAFAAHFHSLRSNLR